MSYTEWKDKVSGHSGQGTSFRIENGVITEESDNHLMVYELTDELD